MSFPSLVKSSDKIKLPFKNVLGLKKKSHVQNQITKESHDFWTQTIIFKINLNDC